MKKHARLILLPVVGAALAFASSAPAHGNATTLHLYAPFKGADVAQGVHVARRARNYCWTTSLTDPRSNAYRCFAGKSRIHDPCFASDTGPHHVVLCPLPHPGSGVLLINLTRGLPTAQANTTPTNSPPWAVHLQNGRWCEAMAGATGQYHGMRINYLCGGPSGRRGYLLGSPNRRSPLWTVFYGRKLSSSSYAKVKVVSAWW